MRRRSLYAKGLVMGRRVHTTLISNPSAFTGDALAAILTPSRMFPGNISSQAGYRAGVFGVHRFQRASVEAIGKLRTSPSLKVRMAASAMRARSMGRPGGAFTLRSGRSWDESKHPRDWRGRFS